ncbi:hypothetical protein VSX64_14450 [Aurantimonas sp. C2-6-R+9]|uniref:hypothetical protein n=1 Tax=unclassified Aurantimonas TaxID=2638230 RepID=UPI002E183FBF|nr:MULTISPECIES: hypothetical protein [unclassified Aurantimonas]MEC5291956.1 hypothetical protein [Aurantimonas sp. C2-3-R2]MEC5382068.1 hypothetical protein [Aurantimonas sp. C2-6-R+9]MEC5413042.1 hypothetical protein [Aurantimonas sp. C2-4-R8]
MPDLECTWWPDVWFGVRLTDCCAAHDLSPLDTASSLDLGACVAGTMAASHPVAGIALGAIMAFGTAVWCGLKCGPRGRRR